MLMLFSRHFSFASLWSTRSGWRRWGVLRLCCEDLMEWEQGGETTGERNRGVERPGERRGIKEEARERGAHITYVDTCKEWGLISVYMVYFLLHAIKTCKYVIIRGSSATLAQQRNLCSAWVCVGLTGSQCLSISQWFKANNFILFSLFAQCCLLENKRC